MTATLNEPFTARLLSRMAAPFGRPDARALETPVYGGQILPYVGFAAAAGIPWRSALDQAGIRGDPEDPSLELTSKQVGRFAGILGARGLERDLAAVAYRHGSEGSYHPRLRAALARAPTLLARLVAAREFAHHTGRSIQLEFHLTPSHLYIGHVSAGRGEAPGTAVIEVARTLALVSFLTPFLGEDWRPHAIGLTSRPASGGGLDEWLRGGRVVGGLPLCILPVPIEHIRAAGTRDARRTERVAGSPATHVGTDGTGGETPVELLGTALPSALYPRPPRVEEAAEMVGMSVRTLQRRLREEGLSYRHMLERARLREGWRLLVDSTDPVRAIARRLGYEEATNFSRTFRRRFGMSPSHLRSLVGA